MRLVIDTVSKRPACPLLQAMWKCDYGAVSSIFPAKTWLVAPTETMRMFEDARENFVKLSELLTKEAEQRDKN